MCNFLMYTGPEVDLHLGVDEWLHPTRYMVVFTYPCRNVNDN